MIYRIFVKTIIIAFFVFSSSASAKPNSPLSNYQQHDILGWQVMIANAVKRDKELYQRILKQIKIDLKAIVGVMPEWSLSYLRKTPLWFEKKMPPPFGNNLFFNGSKKGSVKYNIQHLYGGVVAGSTQSYLALAKIHPWQLLHELTHAYHQQVNTHSYEPILKAYQNAINKNLHKFASEYSRRNHKEYFSTLTEKYFGEGVTYPHNRKELAEHDPIGYCAIVKAWGLLGEQVNNPPLLCE